MRGPCSKEPIDLVKRVTVEHPEFFHAAGEGVKGVDEAVMTILNLGIDACRLWALTSCREK